MTNQMQTRDEVFRAILSKSSKKSVTDDFGGEGGQETSASEGGTKAKKAKKTEKSMVNPALKAPQPAPRMDGGKSSSDIPSFANEVEMGQTKLSARAASVPGDDVWDSEDKDGMPDAPVPSTQNWTDEDANGDQDLKGGQPGNDMSNYAPKYGSSGLSESVNERSSNWPKAKEVGVGGSTVMLAGGRMSKSSYRDGSRSRDDIQPASDSLTMKKSRSVAVSNVNEFVTPDEREAILKSSYRAGGTYISTSEDEAIEKSMNGAHADGMWFPTEPSFISPGSPLTTMRKCLCKSQHPMFLSVCPDCGRQH